MKKLFIALAITASLTVPQAFANSDEARMVAVDSLNVRSSAMVGQNRVGVLHKGDMLELKSTSADGLWCKVKAPSQEWDNVFVACRYISSKFLATETSGKSNGWMEINGSRWAGIKLNVRSSAAFGNNRIGFLNKGDEVWVNAKGDDGMWCQIKWEKNGHTKAYVACSLLTK